MSPPVLQVQGLRFAWPARPLFTDLDIELPAGVSMVCGDDGSGKSTLLALVAGALRADAGRLTVAGITCDQDPTAYRRQVFHIDPQTEAHDAMPAAAYLESLSHHWPRFSADTVADLVDGFGLGPHLAKPLYMLSAGSRRKVWLTAGFAAGAPLTLIDQPFAALDPPSVRLLTELLQDVSDHSHRAWLLADHEAPPDVPLQRCIRLPG